MGGHHDGHSDEPIHQAPWVMWITIAICLAITAGLFTLKILTA